MTGEVHERVDWPIPTTDADRAEHDLRNSGICVMPGVLVGKTLTNARDALYRAAEFDSSHGARRSGFGLDHGEGNHRVWNVLPRDPVFVDLAQHPLALRLVRSVLGWPVLLGNLSANITRPGAAGGLLHGGFRQPRLASHRRKHYSRHLPGWSLRLVYATDLPHPGELVPLTQPPGTRRRVGRLVDPARISQRRIRTGEWQVTPVTILEPLRKAPFAG